MAVSGLIAKASETEPLTHLKGHKGMLAYELIRPGAEGSLHLVVLLDDVEPDGEIELHYHELEPPCDHAYYVISGEIEATIGDRKEVVGPDTLIYCQTDVLHALKNVGNGPAKLLRIGAAATGDTGGKSVFVNT